MDTHANSLIQRVSNKIYQLVKIRPFLTKKAAVLVYKNMILPILEYGDIFLHSASQAIRKKLQTLQNRALRCALQKDKYIESNTLHKEAKLLKLKTLRHIHVLLHMYQLSKLLNFRLWKAHQPTGVRTRSSKKKLITSRRPTNERYKSSITYQRPKLWNDLPSHLQKKTTYSEFKKLIGKLYDNLDIKTQKRTAKDNKPQSQNPHRIYNHKYQNQNQNQNQNQRQNQNQNPKQNH